MYLPDVWIKQIIIQEKTPSVKLKKIHLDFVYPGKHISAMN